jgi:hypothetical protein
MPISIQVTQGLLTAQGEREVHPQMADALLRAHGLGGNAFMEPIVVGHVDIYPEKVSYAGGKSQSLAIVSVTVPSVTFPNQEIRDAFVREATDIIDSLKAGSHPRERTFVNVVYAVEGTWGIGGKAYTNEALGMAITSAAR